ncbi:AMP-binding protein [Streptosporangium sp. NBC_01755]|uniref:AMP-binding protein n=1 Tax=Streptosporangium sp. NBC_01755 TaxID=2975949 RepID=UPI002DD7F692|nr:AMP-binding protein [Streptosporangium sp. NBC_01755]WSC97187.1 AMP-binding protein [Streptosporangium sp. NBC_01755]
MGPFSELVRARSSDDHVALRFEGRAWTWRETVQEAADRAAAIRDIRPAGDRRQVHVGVLLQNLPDFAFWLLAAGLGGFVIVGINPTRRGEELAQDIRHTDCDLLVTENEHLSLIAGAELPSVRRVLNVDTAEYADYLRPYRGAPLPAGSPAAEDMLLLLFSSGSTGAPKAVISSQRAMTRRAHVLGDRIGVHRDTITYLCMPLFHGNSIFTNLAPSVRSGATIVMRRKFSASGFARDIHEHGITFTNYVGRAINYVLATAEDPRDRLSTLEVAYGSEASPADMVKFRDRFQCRIWESYGSTEGVLSIFPGPDAPPNSLGLPAAGQVIKVLNESGEECPLAKFDENGRLLNADEAIGEIVGIDRVKAFEGYYHNPEAIADRVRGDDYWSGDLAFRDERGYFFFAGRTSDWLRVDGENFAAAPIERILSRYDGISSAVVYGVPDPHTGDNVMCAVQLPEGRAFDPKAFERFLGDQKDLGTKWRPRFVRVTESIAQTGTNKVNKAPLRRTVWETADPVWWTPARSTTYMSLTAADRSALREEFVKHDRGHLLPRPLP